MPLSVKLEDTEILKKWVWFFKNLFLFECHTSNHGYGYLFGGSVLENTTAAMCISLPTEWYQMRSKIMASWIVRSHFAVAVLSLQGK